MAVMQRLKGGSSSPIPVAPPSEIMRAPSGYVCRGCHVSFLIPPRVVAGMRKHGWAPPRTCLCCKRANTKWWAVVRLQAWARGILARRLSLRHATSGSVLTAMAGMGKAILPYLLVEEALGQGRLTALEGPDMGRRAYWLVAPLPQWRQKKVKSLVAFLAGNHA